MTMIMIRSLLPLLLTLGCGPPAPPCPVEVRAVPHRLGVHFPQGTPLTWESNPPATGPHYESWAPWARVFTEPVPRGNYVHNLEHGGVVLLHRQEGDAQAAAELGRVGGSLRDDRCLAPINARWLVTPDPELPEGVAIAAAAWGHTYTAGCLDEGTLRTFIADHYARASEDTCLDGVVSW